MSQLKELPFTADLNLDCINDLEEFLSKHEPIRGRSLAHRLGFRGPGAVKAANALMNYAQNKRAAITCRKSRRIPTARQYEEICDRIYREDIEPLVKCW
jgi:hypothetical protein